MSGRYVCLVPADDHDEATLALERAAAVVDLIANAHGCADRSPTLAAFAAGNDLFDAMKRLHMTEGAPAYGTAPLLDMVNTMMAASDDATQAHRRAVDAISAFVAKGSKRKLSDALDGLQTAEEANQRAYTAAIAIGAALPRGDA